VGRPLLTVNELEAYYGRVCALHSVSLEVAEGSVAALLGANGAGKTTTLRVISGLLRPTRGSVEFDGKRIDGFGPDRLVRAGIVQVPEGRQIFADLTVRENLRFFARVLGVEGVEDAIATVGLEKRADSVVNNLSGGQRARASLATALLGDPELLVLDEPTVGQDPVLRRDLWDSFHGLAEDGATLLVSSHVMDEADRCDELLLLHNGDILATGTPDELRERTHTRDLDGAFLKLIEDSA